jgi:hypothetical protein
LGRVPWEVRSSEKRFQAQERCVGVREELQKSVLVDAPGPEQERDGGLGGRKVVKHSLPLPFPVVETLACVRVEGDWRGMRSMSVHKLPEGR